MKLSKWENILKKTLVDFGNKKSELLKINMMKDELIKIDGIRYKEFKLAVLSILWRLSITKDPLFRSYNLGIYNTKIRKILYFEETIGETQYPICIDRYELDGHFIENMLLFFPSSKYEYFTVQRFLIYGHLFYIFVNDKEFPKIHIDAFLRESGILYIKVRNVVELTFPDSIFSKLFNNDVAKMYEKMKS